MADKYIRNASGLLTETEATVTSAGGANAGDIPALDGTGRLDTSLMPVGVSAEVAIVLASETLAAGDFVNIYDDTGAKCRKADASTSGKRASGFVLSAVTSGQNATVFAPSNANTQVTGATPGDVYLSATVPGGFTSTPPSTAGQIVQLLGVATSATSIMFSPAQPIVLA
jgi:hypothetical protein